MNKRKYYFSIEPHEELKDKDLTGEGEIHGNSPALEYFYKAVKIYAILLSQDFGNEEIGNIADSLKLIVKQELTSRPEQDCK